MTFSLGAINTCGKVAIERVGAAVLGEGFASELVPESGDVRALFIPPLA